MYKILDKYPNYKIFENGEIYEINNEKNIIPFFSKKQNNYLINLKDNNGKVVKKYVLNQEEHHKKKSFRREYLQLLEKFEIEFRPEYLFEFYD